MLRVALDAVASWGGFGRACNRRECVWAGVGRQDTIRARLLVANAWSAASLVFYRVGIAAEGERVAAGLQCPGWLWALWSLLAGLMLQMLGERAITRIVLWSVLVLLSFLVVLMLRFLLVLVLVLVLLPLAVVMCLLNKRVEVWLHTRLSGNQVQRRLRSQRGWLGGLSHGWEFN